MNSIIKNYDLFVRKFQKIEKSTVADDIHEKRVTLRRVFPILSVYKIKPSKIKYGEKAFKLFGKLRDVQVQLLKLESVDQTLYLADYRIYLKDTELKLQERVSRFSKKKKLVFPSLKKKQKVDRLKIISRTDKSLNKLITKIQSRSIDDADDIHKIRIEFKKFRYKVEILSYVETVHESKLDKMKSYQDLLGEIQDYEVLMKGIKKFYKKRKPIEDINTEQFEMDQNTLIEKFDNEIESFIEVCRDAILLNKDEVVSLTI